MARSRMYVLGHRQCQENLKAPGITFQTITNIVENLRKSPHYDGDEWGQGFVSAYEKHLANNQESV